MPEHSLFENYELFIRENKSELATPQQAMRMIADQGMFQAYLEALTEGMSPTQRQVVMSVANRQREVVLEEAANVPASSFGYGWTVLSFPILADIYAEPIVAELCNVYPVSSPVVSIPRVRIKAESKAYDSGTATSVVIPTPKSLVRPNVVSVSVPHATTSNLFTLASVSASETKINRRYTLITQVTVVETAGGNNYTHNITVNIRPDNRNQFVATFTAKDHQNATITCNLHGNVNYDTGTMMFQVIISGGTSGSTYVCDHATVSLRFVPYATMKGRTIVSIDMEMIDVTIDPNEDFLVQLTQEQMQDYRAIFQVDLIRILSEAIKRQVLLNKDYDLAYFLGVAETDMNANGTKISMDIADYDVSGGAYYPKNTIDVLRNIITKITALYDKIKSNFNLAPSYVVTGPNTAAALRVMQDFAVNMNVNRGELGWTGASATFEKLQILESDAIPANKIYLSTKAPGNALEQSTIIDLIFNPLYVVQEVTDGNTRNFVRSRTMIEVARTEGLGVIDIANLNNVML